MRGLRETDISPDSARGPGTSERVILCAAQAAHEANRIYCEAIGDDSQSGWGTAPKWQRESAIAGVRFVLQHPEAGPEAQHECWLDQKRAEGWKYGSIKDPEKREHPCFLPYSELSYEQRAKDLIFGAVVRGVLAHEGLLVP